MCLIMHCTVYIIMLLLNSSLCVKSNLQFEPTLETEIQSVFIVDI